MIGSLDGLLRDGQDFLPGNVPGLGHGGRLLRPDAGLHHQGFPPGLVLNGPGAGVRPQAVRQDGFDDAVLEGTAIG